MPFCTHGNWFWDSLQIQNSKDDQAPYILRYDIGIKTVHIPVTPEQLTVPNAMPMCVCSCYIILFRKSEREQICTSSTVT